MSNVIITSSVNNTLKELLQGYHVSQHAILVDENTERHCLPLLELEDNILIIKIQSGEKHKNLETCASIWQQLTDASFDRKSLLINLGGGVIGDMGGFCAKTYKRGIKFINIPTTLLAQVDACVGGKLGIDFNGLKNHIGLFSEPEAVIIHDGFLATLPLREQKSGFAEIIKHHLIADINGWGKLITSHFEEINWSVLINHSIEIKQFVVSKDPLETGLRKVLNFGHTIGHAIESAFLNSSALLLHGEAIALGMICEAHISYQKGLIDIDSLEQIRIFIQNHYNILNISADRRKEIVELMRHDKKNSSNKILCVLLDKIGKAIWDIEISEDEINNSFDYLNQT